MIVKTSEMTDKQEQQPDRAELIELQKKMYSDTRIVNVAEASRLIRHACQPSIYSPSRWKKAYEEARSSDDEISFDGLYALDSLRYDAMAEQARLFECVMLYMESYPTGFLYLCNYDAERDVYKNMGYRYGLNCEEYMSGFGMVSGGWPNPDNWGARG